jgi:hypothetical protein
MYVYWCCLSFICFGDIGFELGFGFVIVADFLFRFRFRFWFWFCFGFGFDFLFFPSFLSMLIVRLMRVLIPNDDLTTLCSTVCPICLFGYSLSFRFFLFVLFRSVLLLLLVAVSWRYSHACRSESDGKDTKMRPSSVLAGLLNMTSWRPLQDERDFLEQNIINFILEVVFCCKLKSLTSWSVYLEQNYLDLRWGKSLLSLVLLQTLNKPLLPWSKCALPVFL